MRQMSEKENMLSTSRKQLWDSLLEVYEEEAGKEIFTDCEEIRVDDLEKWTLHHPKTNLRALPKLVELNPKLVNKALVKGTAQLSSLKNLKEEATQKIKRKRKEEVVTCNVIKKRRKEKSFTKKATNQDRRKKLEKKAVKKLYSDTGDQSLENTLVTQGNNSVKIPTNANGCSDHKCKIKLRHFTKIENPPVRSDGRTFKCQLIFRVCECYESDILF